MKILFDHQIFTHQIYGGISRYFYELINKFKNYDGMECELSLKHSNNYYLKKFANFSYNTFFENFLFKGKYRLLNILNKKVSKEYISRGDYDIFHPTYYDSYFLEYIGNKPFVLTIYDMIHEIYPEMFSLKDNTSKRKKLLAHKAEKIIAISENTKKDIIRFFNLNEKKIEVIYLANSMNAPEKIVGMNISLPKTYILFVGSRGGYKNFNLFIEAISPMLFEDTEVDIVCIGGGNFKKEEKEKFERLNIANRIHQYILNDKILAYLYQNAIAFVFPSLYEGFGIPILEAFSCGCPVVASNASSLPEVAGEAAIYFNPKSKLSILSSVKKVIYDKNLRNQLIEKSIQRVREFSWEKTAKKTKKLYEDIL